jgi:hypothetical protein
MGLVRRNNGQRKKLAMGKENQLANGKGEQMGKAHGCWVDRQLGKEFLCTGGGRALGSAEISRLCRALAVLRRVTCRFELGIGIPTLVSLVGT